ncbi:Succinyl-CoA:(R)-benzylsuccinate CoA-transferase subunit BbsE [bacterium HR29]|jgi:crotonobetainyl-CoA:carnitine CoA-transferase CaiB-like acyl-CoA transferase|nr:Succinyl-CoA:(R)-benzylsuccinate CoA-transferase subunit BbsE [bacterium HR29]
MSGGPLAGVRVLEIGGGIPAAFATRWMAGFGAEVVRSEGPPEALTEDEGIYLLAGKRRISVVEPTTLRRLALAADIVVEDRKPGTLAAWGMAPEDLRAEKPALVIVSITPFGQRGPYAGWEATNLTAFAAGGIHSLTGHPSRPPLQTGGSQALYLGGLHGFAAAITAYFGALVHGEGDWIDLAIQEIQAGMLELYGPRSEYEGGPSPRTGNHVRAVWGLYPCADGYAGVCALERQVPALFALVGDPALEEERFRDFTQRAEHDDELQAILYGWFADKTRAELLELGRKHKVPIGAVLTPLELLASEGLAERGFFDTVETNEGSARVPGRPFLGLPWVPGRWEAPGESTAAVLREWLGEEGVG